MGEVASVQDGVEVKGRQPPSPSNSKLAAISTSRNTQLAPLRKRHRRLTLLYLRRIQTHHLCKVSSRLHHLRIALLGVIILIHSDTSVLERHRVN